ncbi:MAG: Alkyl hydroperoxide reductase AhpD [Promethearchaeota archaeon]|nr:MAG: Alkyl hydroperoxide reductase AhpD [Candidatus Lokiarchaeota archaeon]
MDKEDKEKIQKIISDRNKAHQTLIELKSKVYDAFLQMEKEAFSNRNLKKIYKELIALGISIAINCESCMEWHIHEALKAGASKSQIIETIEVAVEMGGGPATVSSRFALKVLEYYQELK